MNPITASDHSDGSISWLCGAFRRNWLKSLAVFTLVFAIAGLAWVLAPRWYESEAMLFIRVGRESVALDATATTGQTIGLLESRQNEINSVVDLLESRALLEQVVDTLTPQSVLGESYAADDALAREKAVVRLKKWVSISAGKSSAVVTTRCEAPTPELAQRVVQTLTRAFQDLHVRVNRTAGSQEFFAAKETQLRSQVEEAAQRLRTAKNAAGLGSVDGRRTLVQQQVAETETEMNRARALLAATGAKAASLKKLLGAATPRLLADGAHGAPAVSLDSLHPMHQKLAEALLTETAQLDFLNAQISTLTRQRDDLLAGLRRVNEQEVEIADLERQRDLSDGEYRRNHQHLEQAQIDQELAAQRISNVNVAQAATFVGKPVSPKAALSLALGLIVALSAALATAWVSESLRPASAGQLELPVLLVLGESAELNVNPPRATGVR